MFLFHGTFIVGQVERHLLNYQENLYKKHQCAEAPFLDSHFDFFYMVAFAVIA